MRGMGWGGGVCVWGGGGGGGRVGRRKRGKGCRLESREWSVFAATPVMPAGLQRRLILPIT